MSRDGGSGGHRRADEMSAPAGALPPFEVAVGSRGAALAGFQPVRVHSQAHRAAGLAPLEAGVAEHAVEAFLLRLRLDQARARHHERRAPAGCATLASAHRGCRAQVLETFLLPFDDAVAMVRDGRISDVKTVAAILWVKAFLP